MLPEKFNIHWYKKEKVGWHEQTIERFDVHTVQEWIAFYDNIVDWINSNIDGSHKHARWTIGPEYAQFKFRYERDFLLFVLRWS